MKNYLVLILTFFLTSCGFHEVDTSKLNVGPIAVKSDNQELKIDFQRILDRLEQSNDQPLTIILNEDTSTSFPSFETRGHASKRELRYIMYYQVLQNDNVIIDSDYNYNQVFDNNETTQRANRLANHRFFKRARSEGINNLIIDLQNYFDNVNL